jgi:hypothetical protein
MPYDANYPKGVITLMADDNDFLFEPIEEGPDKEANEKNLQQKLADYKAALEQEFELGVDYSDGKLTPEQIRDRTDELLTQTLPKAVARMKHIIEHSTNDNLALNASKFIIERTMGKEGGRISDPLDELLKGLRANDPVEDKPSGKS